LINLIKKESVKALFLLLNPLNILGLKQQTGKIMNSKKENHKQTVTDKRLPTSIRFNIWAFVFNSFYYFYHGIRRDKFVLFFLASPLLAFILFKAGLSTAAAITAAFLSIRLTAAFCADKDVKLQKEESKQSDRDILTPYFSVSRTRVLLFSVITFNIYPVYLAYKNWQIIRDTRREYHISPFLRSWLLGLIFIIPLFIRMQKSFAAAKQKTLAFKICASFYALLIIGTFAIRWYMIANINFSLFNLLLAMQLLKILCLLPVQKTINNYNQCLNPENLPLKKILPGEMAMIAAAAALFISYYSFSGQFAIRRFYRDFDRETRNEIINSYIFQKGYPDICAKYGYQMQNYQRTFARVYQKELVSLQQKLQTKNMTVEQAWERGGKRFPLIMNRRLEKELLALSKEIFETPSSNVQKDMYHFCSFIDMSAELVIKSQLNK